MAAAAASAAVQLLGGLTMSTWKLMNEIIQDCCVGDQLPGPHTPNIHWPARSGRMLVVHNSLDCTTIQQPLSASKCGADTSSHLFADLCCNRKLCHCTATLPEETQYLQPLVIPVARPQKS